jgi:DNA-binding NarL/FixJ family response regulator
MNVLLCDDHESVREGARFRIKTRLEHVDNCFEADSTKAAEEVLKREKIDIVVLDLHLPDCHGLVFLEKIRSNWPEIKVIIFSLETGDFYAIRAIKGGAVGYLTKTDNLDELVKAIRIAGEGGRYFSKVFENRLDDYLRGAYKGKCPEDLLTGKEWLVLSEVNLGLDNDAIAEKLNMNSITVSVHKNSCKQKFHVKTDIELRNVCIEKNLFS